MKTSEVAVRLDNLTLCLDCLLTCLSAPLEVLVSSRLIWLHVSRLIIQLSERTTGAQVALSSKIVENFHSQH